MLFCQSSGALFRETGIKWHVTEMVTVICHWLA